MTWHTTRDAGEMGDGPAPGTAPLPYQGAALPSTPPPAEDTDGGDDDTAQEAEEDKIYTRYNIPTARPLPPPCFREAFKIKRVCELSEQQVRVSGENVTVEDIAQMMFVKSTLSSLKVRTIIEGSFI